MSAMSEITGGGLTTGTGLGPGIRHSRAETGGRQGDVLGPTLAERIRAQMAETKAPEDPSLRMVNGSGESIGITISGRVASLPAAEFLTFRFGFAPEYLRTRRQLRASGLRPGGAQPVARLLWWHGDSQRWAHLYDVRAAKPKFRMTPAKAGALAKAMLARRTCPSCGIAGTSCIPKSLGMCLDCHESPDGPEGQASA